MAERRATNKYYPPEWDPSKGSINTFVGQHPLRERARKLDQGILIVRFELPYNIWCDGCGKHIGMGVRFNAEKKKVGMYYSTPILSFRMKCHLCSHWFEIQTDPKNAEYVVVDGAKRKEESWKPEDNGTIELQDDQGREKLADPFYRLEHAENDKKKVEDSKPIITELQMRNERAWGDPYTNSQKLRKKFREEKKLAEAVQAEAESVRKKHSLSIEILPQSEEDVVLAKRIKFGPAASDDDPSVIEQRKHVIQGSSVFSSSKSSSLRTADKTLEKSVGSVRLVKGGTISKAASLLAQRLTKRNDPFAIPKDRGS
ncbi:CWC16 protein, partial [Cladochytrium replicatum]